MHDFRKLGSLLAALAPLGIAASGCGGSALGDFDGRVCVTHTDGLATLSPAPGTDYVALRNTLGSSPTIVAQWGSPCATAKDAAACNAALAGLAPSGAFAVQDGLPSAYDVAITRGDDVTSLATPAAVVAALGKIDTPNEAALLTLAHGYDMPCDQDNVREAKDGYVVLGTQGSGCGTEDIRNFEVEVSSAGDVSIGATEVVKSADPNCMIGRRPGGLRSRSPRARAVGDFFAGAAHLEAASVHAFAQIASELTAHGAPRSLVRAALRARADEVRHTRVTARLARRFGGRPVRPVVGARPVRTLLDVALDNTTEGCVRETFGALVGIVQSRRAADAGVRRALRGIAADETRHAELSWAIDAWVRSRLPASALRTLDEARRAAVATLDAELVHAWPADVGTVAGMPDAATSRRLLAALDATLWSRA